MYVKINHEFTTLNEYIKSERSNWRIAAKIKREQTEIAYWYFVSKKFETPLELKFTWHIANKKKDPDNIAFGTKFILDGMVKAKAIPNDNLNHITKITHEFVVNKEWQGVEISG